MAIKIKKYVWTAVAALLLIISGCNLKHDYYQVSLSTDKEKSQPAESSVEKQDLSNRFTEKTTQDRTAVESAIELSQKYAKLSEESINLASKNQSLENANKELKTQIEKLQQQLTQNTKELNEANELLMKTQTELNNWKADVIGFRDEMRQSEKAQIEALYKISVALGADVKKPSEINDSNSKK